MKRKNQIHPTALISPAVKMGEQNIIGPYVQLDGDVEIGDGNVLESSIVVKNTVRIGSQNRIYPFVTIGHPGEMGYKGDRLVDGGYVEIGNKNTIREFVNIHSPVRSQVTSIGDSCYIMNKCYLAHDIKIGDHTSLTAGTKLAGRAEVSAHVNMGMGSTVHQRIHVGEGAMVGMNAVIIRHIAPYCTVAGIPARIIGFNLMAAIRQGYDEAELQEIKHHFVRIIEGDYSLDHDIIRKIESFRAVHPDMLIDFK